MRYSIKPLTLILVLWSATAWAAPGAKLPPFDEVQEAVEATFPAEEGHLPGDLISQTAGAAALASVAKTGFRPADAEAMLARVPADGEFLVAVLSTKQGVQFMRKIATMPLAFDRLDRLSQMPHGKRTIEDLVRGPGGDKLIHYMTTQPGGRNLGRQLSYSPTGAGFNASTGRIYTAEQLIEALRESYRAAIAPKTSK